MPAIATATAFSLLQQIFHKSQLDSPGLKDWTIDHYSE